MTITGEVPAFAGTTKAGEVPAFAGTTICQRRESSIFAGIDDMPLEVPGKAGTTNASEVPAFAGTTNASEVPPLTL